MLGLGRAKNAVRVAIATHRRSPWVGAVHRLAALIESSYLNVGADFATNGERHVLERLRKADFRLAVDGGANLGDWSFHALELWPNCNIHAFEVARQTAKRLGARAEQHPERGRLTIHSVGLSDHVGGQTMYYFPDSSELTCDMPRHETLPSIPFLAEMTTLSAICAEQGIEAIDFLKLDLEGGEYLALRGMQDVIKRGLVKCIQFEYGAFSIQTRFLLKDYFAMLGDLYWIGRIFPNYVDFAEYDWRMEDFQFRNYLCIHRRYPELRNLVA